MYREIDFTTKGVDKYGREIFVPTCYSVAKKLKTLEIENKSFYCIGKDNCVDIYTYSIYPYKDLRNKIYIGQLISDNQTGVIYFLWDTKKENNVSEIFMSDVVYQCLRPEDWIIIKLVERNEYNVKKNITYKRLKKSLVNKGLVEYKPLYGNTVKFQKKDFFKIEK